MQRQKPADCWVCLGGYEKADRSIYLQAGGESAAYIIDKHEKADAFVKNAGLGFAIPYLHNGQSHDYMPDFIIRLKCEPPIQLILETKGFDELAEIKSQAAKRWVDAVNAEGSYGIWKYAVARKPEEVSKRIEEAAVQPFTDK